MITEQMKAAMEVPAKCLLCGGSPSMSAMFIPHNGMVRVWYSLCHRHGTGKATLDAIEVAISNAAKVEDNNNEGGSK
jgi:hypothetical protein